jgi:predicted GNAT superfamily acetyltransferase
LNAGVPSDRFHVDWWINSPRVQRRLSRQSRRVLDLAHFLAAEAMIINPTRVGIDGLPRPATDIDWIDRTSPESEAKEQPLLLLEIPADFTALKAAAPDLAVEWRLHTRGLFEETFKRGYLVTDFVYLPGKLPRSFYILSFGESTL